MTMSISFTKYRTNKKIFFYASKSELVCPMNNNVFIVLMCKLNANCSMDERSNGISEDIMLLGRINDWMCLAMFQGLGQRKTCENF